MPAQHYRKIERLMRPVALKGAWRLFRAAHRRAPLGVGYGLSRFAAPNGEFKTLYAAAHFETALRETLVRDRYDGKTRRRIAAHTLRRHACVQIDSKHNTCSLTLPMAARKISAFPKPSVMERISPVAEICARHSRPYRRRWRFLSIAL
jgi:hypothetical protein